MKTEYIQSFLEDMGFGQNEAKVYLSLLELGQVKARDLIEATQLHRHIVYESLKQLTSKHLVSSSQKNNITLFQATDPKKIVEQFESKRQMLDQVVDELRSKHTATKPEVVIYEGVDGPKAVLQQTLQAGKAGEEVCVIGQNEDMGLQLLPNELEAYFAEAKRTPFKERLLFREGFHSPNPNPKAKVKYLDPQFFSPLTINIFGDKVAISDFTDPITTMVVKKKTFADGFKGYFNMLWDQNVKTYKGVEGLKLMMERSLEYPEHWFIGGNAGISRVMPEYWAEYNRRRIEKKIWWHDLIQPTYVLPGFERLLPGQKNSKQFLEFKYLSQEMNSPMVVFFWGNCVVHINWDAKIAFLMEDEHMFKSYRAYFDFLWNQDTFITRGLDKVRDLFYRKAAEMREGAEYAVLWGTYGVETRKEMIPWFETYNRFRIERGLHLRVVMFEEDKKLVEREMSKAGDPEFKLTHMRFSKEKDYGSPMQINIYPDSVVLFTFAPGERATAIEIKGKENRDAMRLYFDGLWRQLKK